MDELVLKNNNEHENKKKNDKMMYLVNNLLHDEHDLHLGDVVH